MQSSLKNSAIIHTIQCPIVKQRKSCKPRIIFKSIEFCYNINIKRIKPIRIQDPSYSVFMLYKRKKNSSI